MHAVGGLRKRVAGGRAAVGRDVGFVLAHDGRVRSDLPSGTVSFLFTDVEGSTKLLHELGPAGYAEALGDHRRVLRDAFTGTPIVVEGGYVGVDVHRAARIAACGHGGQVLVSARLYDLLEEERAGRFAEPVELELKELAGTHSVYALVEP